MNAFLLLIILVLQYSTNRNRASSATSFNERLGEHTRFAHLLHNGTVDSTLLISKMQMKRSNEDLLVFIAVTSSPHHQHLRQAARNTWLLPCIDSEQCDYRFFVDCLEDFDLFPHLKQEAFVFSDLVFRNSCSLLLTYHPNPHINYGNSPPVEENRFFHPAKKASSSLNRSLGKEELEELPNYFLRRRYKIDWKVCFMQWIHRQFRQVSFYVFVEDDSFICSENLLYQMNLLRNASKHQIVQEFRTGTPMFDGFDDSSTIMTRKIAETFVQHYLEPGFNCSNIFHPSINASLVGGWLSWGNSWISKNCNWTALIEERYRYHINRPNIQCAAALAKSSEDSVELHFPCTSRPLILHHARASQVLLKEHSPAQVAHLCEYMLLVDKIKQPEAMTSLWRAASRYRRFHDFSQVFLEDGLKGWPRTVERLHEEEELCRKRRSVNSSEAYPCLFESPEEEEEVTRRRQLRGGRKLRQVSYRNYFQSIDTSSLV